MLTPFGSVDGCVLGAPEVEEAVGPPMNRGGPPMGISVEVGEAVVELVAGSEAGPKATLQQDGAEYIELALDLPPTPYMTPSAFPS